MKSTAKTVGIVMIIMVLSRLLSLVSTSVYSTFYGNITEINIYSYAINLPNVIFNSFGTALTTVVIPIFAGYIGTGDKKRAFKFADNVLTLSLSFAAVLSLLGLIIAPIFPYFTGFRTDGYGFAVMALRIMFPVMIFYSLNYILQGVLQSLGRFNMPAFVSVPSSLIVILYVYLFGAKMGVTGLLVATFIGLAMQGLILIPPVYKTEYRFHASFNFKDQDIKKALMLMLPVLAGTSAVQLNMFFNLMFTANFPNRVMIMNLVQNIVIYAILAFVYSITAVVFPKFTMLAARSDVEGFKAALTKVLKLIIYFLIPATAGFIAVRQQLLNLLVGWGRMTASDVQVAGGFMALYAIGITGLGIKEVADRAFYSLKDTKKPAINGVIVMVVNITSSLTLVSLVGVWGIPAAYSISVLTGAGVITILLRKKIGAFGGSSLAISVFKSAISSVIMFIIVTALNWLLGRYNFGHALLDKGIKLFTPAAVGCLAYFVSTWLLKMEEAGEVVEKLKGRLLAGR